jgi:hypothetical protein
MMGHEERAKDVVAEIIDYPFSKSSKQSVLLTLALCHQKLGDNEGAKAVASEIVRLDRHSNIGLQARTILIELDANSPQRSEKLLRMEKYARRRGATSVANNIALQLAEASANDPARVREILAPVVKSATRDDAHYYNRTRAALKLAKASFAQGSSLSDSELTNMINAYQFLFNERISTVFDQCHEALWESWTRAGDRNNLLTLFRHSSLLWRLRGADKKEQRYLKELEGKIEPGIDDAGGTLDKETAYFRARMQSLKPALRSPSDAIATED